MSGLAPGILTKLQQIKTQFDTHSEVLQKLAPSGPANPETTVTNTRLLIDTLIMVYSNPAKAEYLPHKVDLDIDAGLNSLLKQLTAFAANQTPPQATSVVNVADSLYAVSLQYGMITFGFDQKELAAIVHELQARRKAVRRTAEGIEKQAAELLAKTEETAKTVVQKCQDETARVTTDLASATDAWAKEGDVLKAQAEALAKMQQDLEEKHKAVVAAAETIGERDKQTNEDVEEVAENARVAKAELDAVKELRVKAKAEMEEILAFYGDIEKHTQTMREAQKEASGKFNELQEKAEKSHTEFRQRSDEIVTRNRELQDEIKGHLQKAVGASLFGAFDKRRGQLNLGKMAWAAVLLISVGCGALLSWSLASSLGSGTGVQPAFFVKLSAIIPVTFMIVFSAKQYSNERRTEEEYAFKSAISVSLEPYKDLIQRMKTIGDEKQAGFVEKLLLEVFDNPVRRIYPEDPLLSEEADSKARFKAIERLIRMSKKIDPEKASKLLELVGEDLGVHIKRLGA